MQKASPLLGADSSRPAIETAPLPLPASADSSKLAKFGLEIRGVQPSALSDEQFRKVQKLLYEYNVLLFRDAHLTPTQQYALTKAFDPSCTSYGHGNNKTAFEPKSILNTLLKTLPRVPQVQLIGNGTVYDHEGLAGATRLAHPSHRTFHKTLLAPEDEARGHTRFYRWHIDAALYARAPPRVTTLYGVAVPAGPPQTACYDDGSGETLSVPLGATAFVDGRIVWAILPAEMKSVAVRTRVKYAPHPYVWMASARACSTGLGMESEGREPSVEDLPAWEEDKIQVLPMLWKNAVTGELHFQVHPCAALELLVAPLPEGTSREGALYPDGAHIHDLKDVRDLLHKMQRPGIAPSLVYPHHWRPNDLVIFHNRGVMHTATGTFADDQVRVFHQCNLAASDNPAGPTEEDMARWSCSRIT